MREPDPDEEPIDWKHTPAAAEAREEKAKKLARLLLQVRPPIEDARGLGPSGRREMEKAVGLPRRASDETWDRALDLLQAQYAWEQMNPPAAPAPAVEEPDDEAQALETLPCGCPIGRCITDEQVHQEWHRLVFEQTGITGNVDAVSLRAARGGGATPNRTSFDNTVEAQGKRASGAARRASW